MANDDHYDILKACQDKCIKCNDTHKDSLSFCIGLTLTTQHKDGGSWTHSIVKETTGIDHLNHQSDKDWQANNAQHDTHKQ